MGRTKAVFAMIMLFMGFIIPAGPYMKLKGSVFPKKKGVPTASDLEASQTYKQANPDYTYGLHDRALVTLDIPRSIDKLIDNIGDTLMSMMLLPSLKTLTNL